MVVDGWAMPMGVVGWLLGGDSIGGRGGGLPAAGRDHIYIYMYLRYKYISYIL